MATPYHRLARETPAYAWWRLPVAALVIAAAYVSLTLLLVAGAAVWFATPASAGSLHGWLDAAGDLDARHIDYLVIDLLSIALLIPAVLVGVLVTGPRPVGYLTSVAGRMRWGWLGVTTLIASTVSIVTIGCSVAVTALTDPADVSAPEVDSRVVIALVAVLLVVPLQSAAEEYLFRGYLMQLVGSWSRFAVVPVIVTTPLFVAGHDYQLWGLLDVALFGLTAAILTIRTGGLEAAIAVHAANNVVLFALDALGVLAATDDSDAGPLDLVPSIVASVAVLALVEWAARRRGIQRTREPIPEPPAPMWPPPPWAMWAMPQHLPRYVPAPPPASPALHPDTPDYPGELPPGWR
jgi:membrane protease YdiL (CAAX protease family)